MSNVAVAPVLNINSSPETIAGVFASLCNSKHLSDVTFCIGLDHIPAHRLILAARSDVFHAMFYGPAASDSTDVVIEDIETHIFTLMLQYIYTDQTSILPFNVVALLYAAHKYNLSHLEGQCKEFIKTNLNASNAIRLFNEFFGIEAFFDVKMHVESFICKNFDVGINNRFDFCNIDNAKALAYLVDRVTSMKENPNDGPFQYKVFSMIIEWGKAKCRAQQQPCDGKDIRAKLTGLEELLGTDNMNEDTFKRCIRLCPGFFSTDEIGTFFERSVARANFFQVFQFK